MDGKGKVLFQCGVSGLGWMRPRGPAEVRPSYGIVSVPILLTSVLPAGRDGGVMRNRKQAI